VIHTVVSNNVLDGCLTSEDIHAHPGQLRFPQLVLNGIMPETVVSEIGPEDPEAYMARHRWSNCARALGNEGRALAAFSDALAWIEQPPPHTDVAWESYSCCERVVNLALLLAAHPSLLTDANETQIKTFFHESAAWINAHLEYYGPERTNNHFLNNGRALVVSGSVLKNDALLSTGLAIIERMAPTLFPSDGCLREGSSHYQLVAGGWIFDVLLFARLAAPSDKLMSLEKLATEIGVACACIAATLPNMDHHIGDISPDLHPVLTLARLRLLYGSRLSSSHANTSPGEWLFADRDQFSVIARAVRKWPQEYTTHGHDDLGGFIWLHQGRAILTDAGRQNYLPRAETKAQLGPGAHNTLMINGLGALPASLLRTGIWYPKPYTNAAIEAESAIDGFSLSHNGFKRIQGVGVHRRVVRLAEDGLEIEDLIEGSGIAELSLNWHFAPEWRDDTINSLISSFGQLDISNSDSKEVGGIWTDYDFSTAYGVAIKARCLSFHFRVELPYRVSTKMRFRSCAA